LLSPPRFRPDLVGHASGDVVVSGSQIRHRSSNASGLPGDRIQMIDGVLRINSDPVKRDVDISRGRRGRPSRMSSAAGASSSVGYATLDLIDSRFYDSTRPTVPPASLLHDG
jgi:signal peptidase I